MKGLFEKTKKSGYNREKRQLLENIIKGCINITDIKEIIKRTRNKGLFIYIYKNRYCLRNLEYQKKLDEFFNKYFYVTSVNKYDITLKLKKEFDK
jgi:hypothetical protein